MPVGASGSIRIRNSQLSKIGRVEERQGAGALRDASRNSEIKAAGPRIVTCRCCGGIDEFAGDSPDAIMMTSL